MTQSKISLFLAQSIRVLTVLAPIGLLLGMAPADIVVSLIAVLFLVHSLITKNFTWLAPAWVKVLFVLWIYTCIRGLLSDFPWESFSHAFCWIRFGLFAIALENLSLRNKKWRNYLLYSLGLVLSFLALDSIFQFIVGHDIIGRALIGGTRLTATYKSPMVGITIAWLFLPVLLGLLDKKKYILSGLFGLSCYMAILLSGERMALLLTLFGLLLSVCLIKKLRRPAIIILPLILLITGGILYLKPMVYERQAQSSEQVIQHFDESHYGIIWKSAIKMIIDKPLFGVGLHNYRTVCPDPKFGPLVDNGPPRCSIHPHSVYLEWLVETGLVGLLGFLSLAALILIRLAKSFRAHRSEYIVCALFIAVLVKLWPLATSASFFVSWCAIPLWLLIGWGMSYCHDDQK